MNIESLEHDLQNQFPFFNWEGELLMEDSSYYIERARDHAETGKIVGMEAMIAMALRTSNKDRLDWEEILTMRVYGYGFFIDNILEGLFGLEDTYHERRNDAAQLAVISLIKTRQQRNATVTPEERAEAMVNTSKKFDSEHLTLLNFHYPQVERAQQKLEALCTNELYHNPE